MRIHNARNFRYQEFFTEEYFEKYKNQPSYLINSIDPRLPLVAQFIRSRFDSPTKISNWHYAKPGDYIYNYSGLRPQGWTPKDWPEGKPYYSRHLLGLCIDLKVANMSAKELQSDIRDNFSLYSKYGVSAIEDDTPTWTHISVENTSWMNIKGLWIIPKPELKKDAKKNK